MTEPKAEQRPTKKRKLESGAEVTARAAEPEYVYPQARSHFTQPKNQVKYGPGEGLTAEQKTIVRDHLYPPGTPGVPAVKDSVAQKRLTQYNRSHAVYVEQARAAKRPLTVQEHEAEQSGSNATNASINHIIASGVGQNTLNSGIAQFVKARQDFEATMSAAKATKTDAVPSDAMEIETATTDAPSDAVPSDGMEIETAPDAPNPLVAAIRARDRFRLDDEESQQRVRKSLAGQAAAVGRQQIYSRAIAAEQVADGRSVPADRDDLLKTTLNVMQGTRGPLPGAHDVAPIDAYESLLKQTFDAPGNLRVGHSGVNGVVSTGMDMELDSSLQPSQRSRNLLAAHEPAAPDHDEAKFTTFRKGGQRLSSSIQTDDGPASATGTAADAPSGVGGVTKKSGASAKKKSGASAKKRKRSDATS